MLFIYVCDGDVYLIVVFKGGDFCLLGWYYNFKVNLDVEINVGFK